MTTKQYTLDRIEKDMYVFLLKGDESQQLQVPKENITSPLNEGDIVSIDEDGTIRVLTEETIVKKVEVQNLIEKLKNKKK
nr:DUF3006 domain-containing protein [Lysinibacillus timonensis]